MGPARPPDRRLAPPTRRNARVGFLGRIIVALAAAGLVPVALVSFRLSDLNRDALTTQVLQTHALSANSGSDQIERIVSTWQAVVEGIAATSAIETDPGSPAAKESVRDLLATHADLLVVAIDDPYGAEIFRGQKKSASAAASAILAERVRPSIDLQHSGGRSLLALSRALTNGGRVTAIFDAAAIDDALQTSELGEQATRLLIDRNHRVVAGRADTLRGIPKALVDLAANGNVRGSGRFDLPHGGQSVGAYAPVGGTPWVVLSAQPATVAERIASTLRQRSLVAFLTALALVAGFSLGAYYIVVRPVHDLLAAQSEFGIHGGSGTDIDRLRSSIDALQKRVHDRDRLDEVFLGRYQVLETIGQGGMGTVFRGWDPKLQRPVALKTIRLGESTTEQTDRRGMISALMREAVTIARFQNSHIVAVFDVEESPDAAFIAMEFVDGLSLEAQAEPHALSVEETAIVGIAIASALEAAHAANVVHRDVKPANVLIGWDGAIKVTDFGIADLLNAIRSEDKTVFGTPGYMAPELIRGRPVSPASDLFSVGVTLYRCVTGLSPFDRVTAQATLQATLKHHPTRPSVLNSAVPEVLDSVIMRLLAKDPIDRVESSTELLATLHTISTESRFPLKSLAVRARAGRPTEQDPMYVPTISISNDDD